MREDGVKVLRKLQETIHGMEQEELQSF